MPTSTGTALPRELTNAVRALTMTPTMLFTRGVMSGIVGLLIPLLLLEYLER
jgi:hypothetical protein